MNGIKREVERMTELELLQRWEELREAGEEYKGLEKAIKKIFKGRVEEIGDFKLEGRWIEKEIEGKVTETRQSKTWKMRIFKKDGEDQIQLF